MPIITPSQREGIEDGPSYGAVALDENLYTRALADGTELIVILFEADIGTIYYDHHHSKPVPPARRRTITRNGKDDEIDEFDLCEPIIKKGIEFHPLVRERTALKCALKIVFLRREEPGRIYQGGDIDNRLKTLLDALSVPQHDEQVVGTMSPMYCLLEDDSLVTALDIQTQKLLSQPGTTKHYVHLLIEVDVRVTNPHAYNQMFLGD
jgi:hypothetical protein